MNLSIIWDELDNDDRDVITTVIYYSHRYDKNLINFESSPGLLVFLDINHVLGALQDYIATEIFEEGPQGRKVKQVMKIIRMIIFAVDHLK